MRDGDMTLAPVDLEHFRALEESLWVAETRYDPKVMERLLAPDFIEYGLSGRIYGRSEIIFTPGAPGNINATFPLPGFHARYLSADVVQLTYTSEVVHDGVMERGNRSSIWSRYPDGWKLRFHQGTPIHQT